MLTCTETQCIVMHNAYVYIALSPSVTYHILKGRDGQRKVIQRLLSLSRSHMVRLAHKSRA